MVCRTFLQNPTFDSAALARDRLLVSSRGFVGDWSLPGLALFEFCHFDLIAGRHIALQTLLTQRACILVNVCKWNLACFAGVGDSDRTLSSLLCVALVLHEYWNNLADVALGVDVRIR